MQILMVGLDHLHAPVDVRGRAAFLPPERAAALAALLARPGLLEGVILSTCNRTELYAVSDDPAIGQASLAAFLSERKTLSDAEIDRHFTLMHHEEAAAHLFRVAAGLESQILGEGQIVAQIKEALALAQAQRASGAILDALFRHALSAGKRARSETGIARGAVSVASAAIELACGHFGSLAGRSILILGTGKIGEVAGLQLAGLGLASITLASRTLASAARLADRIGGRAIAFHDLGSVLDRIDVLLCCTGAPHHVLGRDELAPVIERRGGRPFLLIDVSVPPNLDPLIGSLPGCRVCDLEDLREAAERNRVERAGLVPEVEGILAQELSIFLEWLQNYRLTPTIASLRSKVNALCELELERFWQRHGKRLPEEARPLFAEAVRAVADKLLHAPMTRLKGLPASQQQQLAGALRTLFDLSVEDAEEHYQRRLGERRRASRRV